MRERHRTTIEDLRRAIESLPRTTRVAMLEGIERNDIIVGAYSDSNGICPMLAAHRAGGRTSFISFAKAWDRFAFRGSRDRAARRATDRELLILRTHLEASLLDDDAADADLAAAVTEHRGLVAEREREREQNAGPTAQPAGPPAQPVHRASWRARRGDGAAALPHLRRERDRGRQHRGLRAGAPH